jgi:hypothetical protein
MIPGVPVITPAGPVPVERLLPGQLVLTHRGRFRPVLKVTTRRVNEDVVVYKSLGHGDEVSVTTRCRFWQGGRCWIDAERLEGATSLANLKELSGRTSLDVRERVEKYREKAAYLYPLPSQAKLSDDQLRAIRKSKLSATALARRFGITRFAVQYARRDHGIPKNAIPAVLSLDYDFGLVVGYYTAEGNIGAQGRSVSFALCGHRDEALTRVVPELTGALEYVFGWAPKLYDKRRDMMKVCVNARLVADLMESICPGVSRSRMVDPDVLFSNPEFLKGFVVGYWNGDGYRPEGRSSATVGSMNMRLLTQVRLALSHFGVSASLSKHERKGSTYRGKYIPSHTLHTLVMHGDNARRFEEVFYGDVFMSTGRAQIVNDGDRSIFPLVKHERARYRGLVYDVAVAEDHSCSLLNATVRQVAH